jgi:putative Holliday junction resolvase
MTFSGARILALDFGARRIGLAISDPLGLTAQGLPTLERSNRERDLAALLALAREREVTRWVMGLPLHLSGTEGAQAQKVRTFGALLAARSGLPVEYWDERLTTVTAQRVLREAELSLAKRRQAVDRLAAVVLLQSYLEAHRV